MTDKDLILDLIVEASKALIDTDVLIYPAGSLPRQEQEKHKNKLGYNEIANKPEFLGMNHYRDSLLTLVNELKTLYIRIKEDK